MGLKMANIGTISLIREKLHLTEGVQSSKTKTDQSKNSTLLDLLILTRSSEAADPRNKVYILFGLAQDDVAQKLVLD